MAGRRKLRRGIYLLPTAFTTGNLAIADIRVWGGVAGVVTSAPQPQSSGAGQIELTFRVSPNTDNDPNQFDTVWKYKGAILDGSSWNRYDGNNLNSLPFLLGDEQTFGFFAERRFHQLAEGGQPTGAAGEQRRATALDGFERVLSLVAAEIRTGKWNVEGFCYFCHGERSKFR